MRSETRCVSFKIRRAEILFPIGRFTAANALAKMLFDWDNDYLSVAETTIAESSDNRFSNSFCFVVISDKLDFDINGFFDIAAPTVLLNSALRGADSFYFKDRYARKLFAC